MAEISFDEFVNRQSAEAKQTEVDWDAHLEEWKRYLQDFYHLIEEYLKRYITEGKISLDYTEKQIHEESLGVYSVRVLTITIGRSQIRLEPIGTLILGVKGRVDMIGPNGTIMFLLVPKGATKPRISITMRFEGEEPAKEPPKSVTQWEWRIATPRPNVHFIPIDQESLFNAIMEVSNG